MKYDFVQVIAGLIADINTYDVVAVIKSTWQGR